MGLRTRLGDWRDKVRPRPPAVSVVRVSGLIGDLARLQGGISLDSLGEQLERAFRLPNVKTVALAINSPGGSAAQSGLIAQRIRDLSARHRVPVVAFVEDAAASGGYWLACAADEIFAHETSIVGSIGVVSSSFGLSEAIARLGVERRVHTAGERKSFLDAFRPEAPEDVVRLQSLLGDIHEAFMAAVRSSRGGRLRATPEDLFNGDFWSGRRALELGLIDGLGELRGVMRQRYGDEVKIRTIVGRQPIWRRLVGGARGPARGGGEIEVSAARLVSGALSALEARAIWGRLGL